VHLSLLALAFAATVVAAPHELTFKVATRAEVVARIAVQCDDCRWDTPDREAAVFSIAVDSRYSQHLVAVRGGKATYDVMLGRLKPGSHTLRIAEDASLTASAVRGRAVVGPVAFDVVDDTSPRHLPISLAPILYARPNTIGRFTDVPVLMWYDVEPTDRGTRYRYSVIFTNEDGGTPADRLMATWGRTTDIEYVYSVELGRDGAILDEDLQGPDHEILKFAGTREGRHPLLWVSTDNNMVLDQGATGVRYAPAPIAFPLADVSREAVMDAHPWLYAVMARELAREDKIVPDAPPRTGAIPDPRRFVYVEGCGTLNGARLTFAVRAGDRWIASDRGVPEYRIARDGCFRAAIPLPPAAGLSQITGLRAQAHNRVPSGDDPVAAAGPAQLTRINKLFMLDENYRPGPSRFHWTGSLPLTLDGPPAELPLK
jgi:hypothetical protein